MGIVHPAIMLALERGSACWNISHRAEMNNFCLTEISALTSYRRKKNLLLPQVCEFGVRLVLGYTLGSQAVLHFSEIHKGLWSKLSYLHCLLAPPLSSFLRVMVKPSLLSPTLLFLSRLNQ